jgi:hypothetical protein
LRWLCGSEFMAARVKGGVACFTDSRRYQQNGQPQPHAVFTREREFIDYKTNLIAWHTVLVTVTGAGLLATNKPVKLVCTVVLFIRQVMNLDLSKIIMIICFIFFLMGELKPKGPKVGTGSPSRSLSH